jgi:hypothetical protein
MYVFKLELSIMAEPLDKQIVLLSKHWIGFLMLKAPPSIQTKSACRTLGLHFSTGSSPGSTLSNANKTAEIFLLTSVAGAGKTAIAHTVAQRCDNLKERFFLSSFFFDQEVSGRNDPMMLFTTIARDLADQNVDFARQVADALDKKKRLVGASTTLHFSELIVEPSRCLPVDRPVVIIIDALDEGYDLEVLKILRDEVPKLPGTFRILLTSRMMSVGSLPLRQASYAPVVNQHRRTYKPGGYRTVCP